MAKDRSLRSFAIAGAIMAMAIVARAALDTALPATPAFITLYPAVALTGLLCGPLAGAFATVICALAADYLWIPPRLTFAAPDLTDAVSLAVFLVASSVILWAAALLRTQLNEARVAKTALDLGLAVGGVGIWEINLQTRRITASAAAHALHFLPDSRADTTVEDWLRGIHPEDLATARATLRAAVEDGSEASYTYRIFGARDDAKTGEASTRERPRWISARGRVVGAASERRLLCALVDITDQVRVQDELRRERERLRLALEAGSLAVWDYHPGTGEATIDTSYAATLGFDEGTGAASRAQIGERIHPEDRPRVAAEHEAIVASGAPYHIEYRIITANGDIRWLVSQGMLMPGDTPSDPGRIIGIIQDITERRRREDALRELAATRELLVREADHRIKNSLQLVQSLLSVQLRGIDDPGAADALREAIARVGAIAASHLALQESEDLKEIDLAVSLRELCAHFAELHPSVSIECRSGAALMLDADRAIPLGLAVSEVLTNALRHAFPERRAGRVIVEAMKDGAQLVISVRDDGVGMQMQSGRTGLGSRIIRALAAQLSATIQVESRPQAGTLVTVRLPLNVEEPARRAVG